MSASSGDAAEARVRALDRLHGSTKLYAQLDSADKSRAKASFQAYEAAVRSGDGQLAEAARKRFLDASAVLAGGRKARS